MSFIRLGKRNKQLFDTLYTTRAWRKLGTVPQCPQPVLFNSVGTAGVVTLNRPKQLNTMDYVMWRQLLPRLQAWERNCSHVIIKGNGKAFCAGGNIKWLFNSTRDLKKQASAVLMNNGVHLLHTYRIPSIAIINGAAFAGGLMLAKNNRYIVATEQAQVAAPESCIGLVNDLGATYHLSRLDNYFGFYMSLTGKRLAGKDVVSSGLATHFVPNARLQELEDELLVCRNLKDIELCLNKYSEPPGEFSLRALKEDIVYCFSADNAEEISERLLKLDSPWSRETLETINRMCPTMLKVNLRALHHGKASNIKQCLRMEYRIASRCFDSYNAQEGVRSMLVTRTKRPNWQPRTLSEVTDAMVDGYFEPMPEELTLFDEGISKYSVHFHDHTSQKKML